MSARVRTAATPDDFARLNLRQDRVDQWEDGMRTTGRPGGYEWWYFDAHLDDGSALVVVFSTKESLATWTGLHPSVSVELDRPGQQKQSWRVRVGGDDFSASRDRCAVRIDKSTLRGDLHAYELHVEAEGLTIDLTLSGEVPAWRPQTGHFLFGDRHPRLFAWLPAVPQGAVIGRITAGEETRPLTGIGYHDHNWGDASMMRLMNHWYWGRAQAGPYSVIASWLVGAKRYRYDDMPIFMLARHGHIIADDASQVRISVADQHIDEASGMPYAGRTTYEYAGELDTYIVTFQREATILRTLPSDIDSKVVRTLIRLARIRGAYLRFTGTVTVERVVDREVVERHQDHGIWEVTYFAEPPKSHWSWPHGEASIRASRG